MAVKVAVFKVITEGRSNLSCRAFFSVILKNRAEECIFNEQLRIVFEKMQTIVFKLFEKFFLHKSKHDKITKKNDNFNNPLSRR